MDHIRTILERINFLPFNYEYTFLSPPTDRTLIKDMYLSLHGAPSLAHPGGQVGLSCNNIHFYADGKDLTPFLIAAIKEKIAAMDQQHVKEAYEFALGKWLELAERMGGAYGTQDMARERETARRLLATPQLNSNLDQLGNYNAGWGGNLHIFNFIYKEIELEPVSILDLVNRYVAATPGVPWEAREIKRLTFSSGPCRLFSNQWNPENIPTGGLECLVEFRVHNLLADRVTTLETQLALLQQHISDSLTALEEYVRVETNTRLREMRDIVRKTDNSIIAAQSELAGHKLQLSALQDSTQEILRAVSSI